MTNCIVIGQSKELIVKEKPAPEEDEEETMADEEKDKPDEGEEEKDKEEPKVVEKEEPKVVEKAQQPEMLLVASAPKVLMIIVLSPLYGNYLW